MLLFFCIIHNHVIITVTYNIILISNLKSKIRKINENKKIRKEVKINKVYYF